MSRQGYYHDKELEDKKKLQKEIDKRIESFLRKGGKIEPIERGKSAYNIVYKNGKITKEKASKDGIPFHYSKPK